MFKKIIAVLTVLISLLTFASCNTALTESIQPENTPISTEPPIQTQQPEVTVDLSKYTIVYPAGYEDWQMEDVKFLQEAIKKTVGIYIPVISDAEAEVENEIILASSTRQTKASTQIAEFASELDYIVSYKDNDIVLGGKSYWADMRAIYDFTEHYLGYDEVNDKIIERTGNLINDKIVNYEDPSFTTMAGNLGKYPFLNAGDVKTMAEAGFNMVKLDISKFDISSFRTYAKWCARYNVRILQRTIYDIKTNEFNVNDIEFSKDCPIIYGHYARVEYEINNLEMYDEMCTVYKNTYSDIGWKFVLNFDGVMEYDTLYATAFENKDLFKDADVISITEDLGYGQYDLRVDYSKLDCINKLSGIAHRNGLEVWFNVACTNGIIPPETKSIPNYYRWNSYMALAFGATGIQYEQYRRGNVVNDDFAKGIRYDDIKTINFEMLAVGEVYAEYELLGVQVYFQKYDELFGEIQDQYTEFPALKSFVASSGTGTPFIFAYMKAKDGSDKYAMVVVDITEVDKIATVSPAHSFEFTKNNVLYYKDGVATEPTKNTAGAFKIAIRNGCGAFITIE